MHANRPDLLENGVLILHDSARPHLGKDVHELLDKYSWEVLPHLPYSPDMSPPRLQPLPKIENQHAWCAFLYAGGPICLRYPKHRTAQLFYRPDGYHGPSKTGCSHSTEGGLHWRTITLSCTSGALFCQYWVLCISFEITLIESSIPLRDSSCCSITLLITWLTQNNF